jgi:tetratricopeptide (TPR) repeat protein
MATSDELLQRGIAAARAGQAADARQWLAQAVKVDPHNEVAWLWMSSVVETNEQRIYCLQQVLAVNPHNELALKGMQALGVQPPASAEQAPIAVGVSAPDGVPVIDSARLSQAQRAAEEVLRSLYAEEQQGGLNIDWAEPERVQRRSRSMVVAFSPQMMMIGGAALGGIVLIVLIVLAVNALSGGQRAAPTGPVGPLMTATPSITPRPTRTPTPVGTPFNPGPTLPAGDAPRGDLRFGQLTATAPYVATPHPASPRLNDALDAFFSGRYNDALELIEKARNVGDNSVDGYWIEGMSLAYQGDMEQAKLALQKGLEIDQSFAPLHVGMSYLYEQEGSMAQAQTSITKALELDPKLVMAYVQLADLDLRQGNPNAALKAVEDGKTAGGNEYDVTLLAMQGRIFLATGDYVNATAVGNLAYYIDPGSEEVVLLVARGRMGLGLQSSAIDVLENHLDTVNPSSAEAWALLAKAYNKLGRTADATEANRRALQLSGKVTDALVAQALLYIDQGNYEQACSDLEDTLKKDDKNYEARYGHAVCSLQLGDAKQAVADLEFVRAETPNKPDIETLYVQALAADKQWNKAISAASAVYNNGALEPEQKASVLENQAYAYYQVGNWSAASLDIEAALKAGETGTRHYYRGLILEALQDYNRAALEYEWVLFWDRVYHYPFTEDVEQRLAKMPRGTLTPTPTASATPSPTKTPTQTSAPTKTPTPGKMTPSPTVSPQSPTVTPTPPKTPTPGGSKTPTLKASKTPTPKASKTPTP